MRNRLTSTTAAILLLGVWVTSAHANVVYVDDDGLDCPTAAFSSVNEAISQSPPKTEVRICPGTYEEQIVLTKDIRLVGEASGTRVVVIKPPALPQSRPSLIGGNPITAGIIVDTNRIRVSGLTLDMSANDVTACLPKLVGIYARNARGVIDTVQVTGIRVAGRPDCESGVGIYVESGQIGVRFGVPVFGRASVRVNNSRVTDFQKVGFVAVGPNTRVKVTDSEAVGDGPTAGVVQYGFEAALSAKAVFLGCHASAIATQIPDKFAAGILSHQASRITVKRPVVTDGQTGVFVLGDRARVKAGSFGNLSADAIVFLGDRNSAVSNAIDQMGIDGVFIDGDRNSVRGGTMVHVPVGVWFHSGFGNRALGIEFTDVPFDLQAVTGGTRNLGSANVMPFLPTCMATLDCDDGALCTDDVCNVTNGACTNGPVTCDDSNPCTDDVCDPVAGCISTFNTAPCDDGNSCTVDDHCSAGTCIAGTPIVCNDGNQCTIDACSPTGGCVFLARSCDDSNPCTVDSCDPATGCSSSVVADGTSCADGNVCNGAETCQGGVCTTSTPVTCTASSPCMVASCDSVLGCQETPVTDGTPCADANQCNGTETCQGGVCTAGTPPTCTASSPCMVASCDSALGCQETPVADNTPCPDGNVCNGAETCQAGACSPGTPLTCTASGPCTTASCDPSLGCQETPVADNTPCPDGDVCNGDETCQAGACSPGTPLTCTASNECMTPSCDAGLGCQETPLPDGTPCSIGTCLGGVCQ
jgi:hypothetical protein